MSIHQEVTFSASPERIYRMLTNGETFAAVTGGRSADIGTTAGAPFSIFGGFIEGRQIELVADQRIVQAWRFSDWAPGVYSLVTLTITAEGNGSRLVLDQDCFPEGASPMFATWKEHIAANWPVFYFAPFTAALEPERVG